MSRARGAWSAPVPAEDRPRLGQRGLPRLAPAGGQGRTAAAPSLWWWRRRLLLVSAPFVALLALLGLRLVTLNAVHERTLAAYQAGDRAATLAWGERQGWVNTVERNRRLGTEDQGEPGGGTSVYPKPW